jgi:hypothetical protein
MKATCGTCETVFDIKPYRLRRSKTGLVFCSPACKTASPAVCEAIAAAQRTAVDLRCPVCDRPFTRTPAELREKNYCSYSCSATATMQLTPIPKGERRAPATEFRAGQRPANWCPPGTTRLRRKHDEPPRAYVKLADGRWRLRSVVNWETANGPLLPGQVVHHKDRDPLNDDPANLEALTRAEHLAEHRAEIRAIHPAAPPAQIARLGREVA